MLLNTISQNTYIKPSFNGKLSQQLLHSIAKGIKNVNSDTFEKSVTNIPDNQTDEIIKTILKSAIAIQKPIVKQQHVITPTEIKGICVNALKGNNPYETTIIYDKQTQSVIGKFKGNDKNCKIHIDNSKPQNSLEIHHGHPQQSENGINYTLPVSMEDFEVLNNNNSVSKITAYNISGEKSELEKGKDFIALAPEQTEELKSDYLAELKKAMPDEIQSKFEYLQKQAKKHKKEAPFIIMSMYKKILNFQYTREGAKAIDTFWKNYSDKYNLSYTSDFTI